MKRRAVIAAGTFVSALRADWMSAGRESAQSRCEEGAVDGP